MMDERPIDLSALSERELLILLADKVSRIETWMRANDKDLMEMKLEMARVKNQMRIWATVAGIIGGGIIAFAVNLLSK